MKKSILLATTALLALAAPAFAADKETYKSDVSIEKDSNGNYVKKTTVSGTDANGTDTKTESKVKVKVDSDGNTDKTTTTKTVSDPKGLGNKHVTKSETEEKMKDGKVTKTHKKTVDGKNVDGTTDDYSASTKVKADAEGNYDEKVAVSKTDANGTSSSYEKHATVDVDSNGDTDKKTTTKNVVDPEGLMNKTTVKTSNKEDVKDGKVKASQEVKINGKTVESNSTTSTQN